MATHNADWRTLHTDPRMALYMHGVRQCVQFCELNEVPLPVFMTYEEATATYINELTLTKKQKTRSVEALWPLKFLQRVIDGNPATVGAGTGLYKDGHIFVNLSVTAAPAAVPGNRRYSWPGYKVDRTAAGVVAHECGHHVDKFYLQIKPKHVTDRWDKEWRMLIQNSGKKPVSGYEPKPSEAFAETMRLFILNPDLLHRAIPARYYWLIEELNLAPVEKRGYGAVLDHPAYTSLAERWIAA